MLAVSFTQSEEIRLVCTYNTVVQTNADGSCMKYIRDILPALIIGVVTCQSRIFIEPVFPW